MTSREVPAAGELVAHRPMLFGLAYRLLGSAHDAEDVLQEAYLRWARADRDDVRHPRRYLARVVTRLSLDALRARQARRELYPGVWLPEPIATDPHLDEPEPLSIAMMHLLEQLSPPERASYVLRIAFTMPYAEISELVDCRPEHCRQLFRRATAALEQGRRRFAADPASHERLLASFVAAAREGHLEALGRLLHADVVAWNDGGGTVRAARNPVRGAWRVARLFAGIWGRKPSPRASPLVLNGAPALLMCGRRGTAVLALAAAEERISAVYLISNPVKLAAVSGLVSAGAAGSQPPGWDLSRWDGSRAAAPARSLR